MNVMRQWIAIIVLFVASASIAVCSEMEAGNATFDLGDGYKSSFVLPDIGTEYVLDYELKNDKEVLDDFSMRYSDYARDKEIYYIVVDNNPATPVKEAYMFNGNQKIILNDRLFVGPKTIEFNLDEKTYSFPKEEGKNFYFVIIYDKGGERYVYTG